MRRIISIFLCLLVCVSLTCSVCAAQAEVTSLTAEVLVSEDGSCNISMTVKVRFLSTQNQFTLPLASGARQITASGASFDTDEIDDVKCVIFKSKTGFSGNITFVCSYTLPYMVTQSDDGTQIFSLNLPEKGWDFPIEKFDLTVSFPSEITALPTWYSAYHGVDIENYLDISVDGQQLHVTGFERLKDRETVSMKLAFADEAFDLRHLPGQTVSVVKILYWLLALAFVGYWFFRLRRKWLRPALRQTAATEATAGEIPCQLSGSLPDAAAMFAHWGNLGYLTISRNRNGRIVLRKQMEMGSERSAGERKLFYSIFSSSDTVDGAGVRVQKVSEKIGIVIQKSWNRRLFRKNSGSPFLLRALAIANGVLASLIMFDLLLPASFFRWILLPLLAVVGGGLFYLIELACLRFYSRRWKLFLLGGAVGLIALWMLSSSAGCFGLVFLSILLQIFCAIATMFGGLREPFGNDLVRQLLGLRSFLRTADAESLRRLQQADSQYYYRMLPFAEQLGVASAFSKRCDTIHLEPCPWLIDSLSEPLTASEFYALYAQIAAAIRNEPTMAKQPAAEVPYG